MPRGQFPSMTSCKNFINCWDGAAIEQECGPGTLFNDQTGYCDYPEAVVCGSRPLYCMYYFTKKNIRDSLKTLIFFETKKPSVGQLKPKIKKKAKSIDRVPY